MQFKDAAYEILKDVGAPLHYNEITDLATQKGILTTSGQTPHATMGALLYTDTLKENSRFRRGDSKGTFTLRAEPPSDIQQQIRSINMQARKTLRKRLQQMDPRQFEKLVKHLLDEMGLEETSVTTYGGDGGIDVRGVLNAENLSQIELAVQAKRWKGNVGSKVVRELRGSLKVHEHGIVITPSDFTSSAKAEADESGKVHISLINGEQLVDLLIEHQLGVASVEHTVHVLDDDFWSEILGETLLEPSSQPTVKQSQSKSRPNIKFPMPIQAEYKGRIYKAELLNLKGNLRYAGQIYDTPSGAAKAVAVDWKAVNGWDFWRFLDPEPGKWEKISQLRASSSKSAESE
jgi:restriction system protein